MIKKPKVTTINVHKLLLVLVQYFDQLKSAGYQVHPYKLLIILEIALEINDLFLPRKASWHSMFIKLESQALGHNKIN